MTAEIVGRALALLAAAVLRHRGPKASPPVVGLLIAVGVFGVGPARLPGWPQAGILAVALASFFVLVVWSAWPPIASAAAESGLFFGLPILAWAGFVLRGSSLRDVIAAMAVVAALLAAVAAGGSQAGGEAGWRRLGLWVVAAFCGAVAGSALGAAAHAVVPRLRPLIALLSLLVAAAAFVPAFAVEGKRVLKELGEEAKLGLLPAEDVETLARPWRRLREPRFGRADERHTYVRSALLLAVALQQQRRRTGTAVRLRQLEVLTFRTRVRRTIEARSGRATAGTDELTLPA